jgi:peptide/nickel transport system substrate-binding protein
VIAGTVGRRLGGGPVRRSGGLTSGVAAALRERRGRVVLVTAAAVALLVTVLIVATGGDGTHPPSKTTATTEATGPHSPTSLPGAGAGAQLAGEFGTLPGTGTGAPSEGGVVTIGEMPGAGPDWILPITPEADAAVFTSNQFQDYMWRPLWWSPEGASPEVDYSQSIAAPPAFSNGGRIVTISLRPGWKWSDGAPVTSTDVEFMVDLARAAVSLSPADYSNYMPGQFPDIVSSMSTPDADTLVIDLRQAWNEQWVFLDQLIYLEPLPSHAWARTSAGGPILSDFSDPSVAKAIYEFLAAQSRSQSTYQSNPLWQVVDGPFELSSFDPATGGNTLVPNRTYSGPVKPRIAELVDAAFTNYQAELSALLAGRLTVAPLDASQLSQVDELRAHGYTVFGYPDFSTSYVIYNFKDATGDFDRIIAQLYVRQALAHLEDQQELVESQGVFDGAAAAEYGPVPTIPHSTFDPPSTTQDPYPHDIGASTGLLRSHGWDVVPGGQTRCESPGTGAGDCGEGIPKGTALSWNIFGASSPAILAEDRALASAAELVGITIKIESQYPDLIDSNLDDATDPRGDDLWAMQDLGSFDDSLYPTTQLLFGSTSQYNIGGYSDPVADTDMAASESSQDSSAIERELSYITEQQPGLFQPAPDVVVAFKDTLHGPTASFAGASQYQYSPEYWYFTS